MNAQIFISHSSKDQEAAQTICAALENRGIHCWVASRNVQPGENFQESIVQAIRSAKVMVLVFTQNANNSAEIKKEIALASQYGLAVIPVRVEDVVPNDALAYELATRQWIDLFRDWERATERLSARIGALLALETPKAVPPEASQSSVSLSTEPRSSAAGQEQDRVPGKGIAEPQNANNAVDDRALGRSLVRLSAYIVGVLLANISIFLLALFVVFLSTEQYGPAFIVMLPAIPLAVVARRTIEQDKRVRILGLVICGLGLLAIGGVFAAPYIADIQWLQQHPGIRNACLLLGVFLAAACNFYGWEWPNKTDPSFAPKELDRKMARVMLKPSVTNFTFASLLVMTVPIWVIFYAIEPQVAWLIALIVCHLAISIFCYLLFRKETRANPAWKEFASPTS